MAGKMPKGRTGLVSRAAQFGEVAAFLCSDAADGITGVSLPVDGGWTAQ